jgi:hypothetical protein
MGDGQMFGSVDALLGYFCMPTDVSDVGVAHDATGRRITLAAESDDSPIVFPSSPRHGRTSWKRSSGRGSSTNRLVMASSMRARTSTGSSALWGERMRDGQRFDIIWPPGFRLDLTGDEPTLLEPDGTIFGRDGDLIANAGGSPGDPAFICQRGGKQYLR